MKSFKKLDIIDTECDPIGRYDIFFTVIIKKNQKRR